MSHKSFAFCQKAPALFRESVYFRNMHLNKLPLILLVALCVSCSSQKQKPYPSFNEPNGRPTLSVWGFTCEIGGKKCQDRQAGREMRELVITEMSHLGKFREEQIELGERKHMNDVSDMLWGSNEPDVLQDLIRRGHSDYLVFGRVLEYDKSTRQLVIELTLVNREEDDRLVVQGRGASGSLPIAVKDAVSRFAPSLENFMD